MKCFTRSSLVVLLVLIIILTGCDVPPGEEIEVTSKVISSVITPKRWDGGGGYTIIYLADGKKVQAFNAIILKEGVEYTFILKKEGNRYYLVGVRGLR